MSSNETITTVVTSSNGAISLVVHISLLVFATSAKN